MHKAQSRAGIRGILVAIMMIGQSLIVAGASAQTVPFYSLGAEFQFEKVNNQLLIALKGQVELSDLAIDLQQRQLTSSMTKVGEQVVAVEVAEITPELIAELKATPGVAGVYRAYDPGPGPMLFGLTEDILVRFKSAPSAEELADFAADYSLLLQGSLGFRNYYKFHVIGADSGQTDAMVKAANVYLDARVAYAQADLVTPLVMHEVTPGDEEFYSDQWHLDNNGSFGFPDLPHADISVKQAWEITDGAGARVGMFDTGLDISHEDLVENYLGFSNNVIPGQDDAEPIPDFSFNSDHGTAVMGLIIAADNGLGVIGVAPEARWTATGGLEQGFGIPTSGLINIYTSAVENQVDVHNNSWGGPVEEAVVDAINNASLDGRDNKGMVIVFALGNAGQELQLLDDYGTLQSVIGVGASGQSDTRASYSNYGAELDIMGASLGNDGVGLATTDREGQDGYNDGTLIGELDDDNYTNSFGGTSGASPVVSGVATLVVSNNGNPELNRHQVRELLTHTADQVSEDDAKYDTISGFSPLYGFGRINAEKAVDAAVDSLAGNVTWPGAPADINLDFQAGTGDVESSVTISWRPTGMPGEEDGDLADTDETEILIVYYAPSGTSGPEKIAWRPTDGQTYDGGDINDVEDGETPDFFNLDMIVLYQGPAEDAGTNRRQVTDLAVSGEEDSPQQFGIYAINSKQQYSFGVLINEQGDVISGGSADTGDQFPSDDPGGRTLDPEIYPDQPGVSDPVSVTATASTLVGFAPLSVEFHGGALTPNEVLDRGWNFGDGTNSADQSIAHTYQQPGKYLAVFFAEDKFAVVTKRLEIEVLDPDTGTSIPDAPTSAKINTLGSGPFTAPDALVRFSVDTTGIGIVPDTQVSYSWEFGDGHIAEGQTVENIFANPGFFSVVVRVREEFASQEVRTYTASTIVEIEGPATITPGQTNPDDGNEPLVSGEEPAAASGMCGAMSPAMVSLLGLSLLGLGCQFRRRCGR
ncbi:MAG: hypothetical protein HJJLKODD_01254 [Phycisphaerae bacterium]|nr:hypothetical protein [Phycisphaerae bacterium]